jgi:hypothetical protein
MVDVSPTELESIIATQNFWSHDYRSQARYFDHEHKYRAGDRAHRISDLLKQSTSALLAIFPFLTREERDLVVDENLQPKLFNMPQEGVPPS